MEDQGEQSRELLFAAESLANMSHELRSPLASIKGYTTTLLRNDQRISSQERQEFLLAINKASDRLILLLDHFLELSQLEAGTLPFAPVVLHLIPLVREATRSAQQMMLQRQQTIYSEPQLYHTLTFRLEAGSGLASEQEALILGDQSLLRKVLRHLLDNASLYSPEGSPIDVVVCSSLLTKNMRELPDQLHPVWLQENDHLAWEAEQHDLPGFEICIRDQGIGIPSEYLTHIFKRFYRVDTRLVREVNGLGLGLTICKYIVVLHGGAIWVESESGQGSTFHIWLPSYISREG